MLMYPLLLAGRAWSYCKPLPPAYRVYFFFPFYHTGGAEKVHTQVAQGQGGSDCIVYFTRKSADKRFYNDFVASECVIKDISLWCDNKLLYFLNIFYRGFISAQINRQKQPCVVFNGQCNFAYKISPWIKAGIKQVELSHSFNTFSWIRLPFLPFIDTTVMISKQRVQDHYAQYKRLQVPGAFAQKISYIVNGIPLPQIVPPKNIDGDITILYVGRGTTEKRVHLVARMAEKVHLSKLPVTFVFLGEVKQAIPAHLLPFCTLLGNKENVAEINEAYASANVVIITSFTEGFPMVIEEGMAWGCSIMATPVGDIPYHVHHLENGFLFSTIGTEEIIVKEGVDFIQHLCHNRQLLIEMGANNTTYAYATFGIKNFNLRYKQILQPNQPNQPNQL